MYIWGKQSVEDLEGFTLTEENRLDLTTLDYDKWFWAQVGHDGDNIYTATTLRQERCMDNPRFTEEMFMLNMAETKGWPCNNYKTTKEYSRRQWSPMDGYSTEEIEAEIASRKKLRLEYTVQEMALTQALLHTQSTIEAEMEAVQIDTALPEVQYDEECNRLREQYEVLHGLPGLKVELQNLKQKYAIVEHMHWPSAQAYSYYNNYGKWPDADLLNCDSLDRDELLKVLAKYGYAKARKHGKKEI